MIVNDYDFFRSNTIKFVNETTGIDNNTLKITASSHYPNLNDLNRSTIEKIFDYSNDRWVSDIEDSPSFMIEFPLGPFYFQSYAMKWIKSLRYNNNWKVEGFYENRWDLIDNQNKELCEIKSEYFCTHDIQKLFVIENPTYVTKIRFTATSIDSSKEKIFSLTQIMLFGQYQIKRANGKFRTVKNLILLLCTEISN